MISPTMTVSEVTKDLRACGEHTSEAVVRAMIINRQYSFGAAFKLPKSSRWTFRIYRKDFENWKKSKDLRHLENPNVRVSKEQAAIDKFYRDYPEYRKEGI